MSSILYNCIEMESLRGTIPYYFNSLSSAIVDYKSLGNQNRVLVYIIWTLK